MTVTRGFQASLEFFTRAQQNVPYFTDVFDEETFYIFAGCFILGTLFLAFILSRFITIKEVEW